MKLRSRILFPLAVALCFFVPIARGAINGPGSLAGEKKTEVSGGLRDTVIYPRAAYKLNRRGNLGDAKIADSILAKIGVDVFDEDSVEVDTLPHLTARDTIPVPDSLAETDPWLYKYYHAVIDSLIHRIVSDSLQVEGDSLFKAFKTFFAAGGDSTVTYADTLRAYEDSTLAQTDWADKYMVDSLYLRDSTDKARAAFLAWYNSLSKEERKKYDFEQKELRKKAVADSLAEVKEEKDFIRDSIMKVKPRILETYAVTDSMKYKRIIGWNVDRDVQDLNTFIPDTSFNYHFYDYPFMRKDVNASWLGVAGSPVQTYNFFNRTSVTGVSFWEPYESWTFSPSTLVQYNTKTPHTELAYFGTLVSTRMKESDNIHILTTQNITPAMNFTILYDKWGGGGMLINEDVKNKTFAAGLNYLGKRYVANAGFIHNSVLSGENGGIVDIREIRDTTIDSREVKVSMTAAQSATVKNTWFADQQISMPFNFINDIKTRRDSTFVPDTVNITTAFLGHSIEYSTYWRKFMNAGYADSLGQGRLDNKIYFRLQPWKADGLVSKIDVGLGDYLQHFNNVKADTTYRVKENSLYAYAGARGQIDSILHWSARARTVFAGADAGNMDIRGNVGLNFFPFRKARTSPIALNAEVSSSLTRPTFYQRHMYSTCNELYRWDNNFGKTSTTKFEFSADIPYWKFNAKAGYALVGNHVYYDTLSLPRQFNGNIGVFSAYVRKEFVFWNFLHLDNKVLFQHSTNQEVLPLPEVALNLKYFIGFPVEKNVLQMQIGLNAWWNTDWYSPAWNYITGTFYNQNEWQYCNGPFFDVFINMQWKKCCLFIKLQNLGKGWPMDHADYFSAHRHIITDGGTTGLKFGIFWPFYLSPEINRKVQR